jgi:hypothetical protein
MMVNLLQVSIPQRYTYITYHNQEAVSTDHTSTLFCYDLRVSTGLQTPGLPKNSNDISVKEK